MHSIINKGQKICFKENLENSKTINPLTFEIGHFQVIYGHGQFHTLYIGQFYVISIIDKSLHFYIGHFKVIYVNAQYILL